MEGFVISHPTLLFPAEYLEGEWPKVYIDKVEKNILLQSFPFLFSN